MDTPEFLVWAIEYTCPIRGFQDGHDAERTERQLRAVRAVNDARRGGRVFEGLCLDPPDGFRIDEALAIHGGLSIVDQICRDCPANAAARLAAGSLAGCFGILPLSPEIHASVDRAIDKLQLAAGYERLFSVTQPRWYGLWIHSPLNREHLLFLLEVFAAIEAPANVLREFYELQAGLQAAIEMNLSLHAALYPRGRVEGTWWQLSPHCPRCKALWNNGARHCGACGYVGHPAPAKKRRARGRRPYFPLSRLLGTQATADMLLRYASYQKQR